MTSKQIDALKVKYEPLIRRVLTEWGKSLRDEGYSVTDVSDMSDECYSWSIAVYAGDDWDSAADRDAIVDISVTLAESRAYDGSKDENGDSAGVNILVNVVAYGGRILGGFSPYNYSDRVWTDDEDEIEDRMMMFADIDADEITESVNRHMTEVA